jgi:hypothetical protein
MVHVLTSRTGLYEFRYFHGAGFGTIRFVSQPVVVFDAPVATAEVESTLESPMSTPPLAHLHGSPMYTDASGASLSLTTTPMVMPPAAAGVVTVAPVADVALLSATPVVDDEMLTGTGMFAQLGVRHCNSEPCSAVTQAALCQQLLTRFVVARSLTEAAAATSVLSSGRAVTMADVPVWTDPLGPPAGVVEVRCCARLRAHVRFHGAAIVPSTRHHISLLAC